MKTLGVPSLVIAFLLCAGGGDSAQMPVGAMPPGARGGGVFPAGNAPLDNYKTDPTELTGEAKELAALAAQLPTEIDAVNKGALPKDLSANLKRIEKISKHLRSEIVP